MEEKTQKIYSKKYTNKSSKRVSEMPEESDNNNYAEYGKYNTLIILSVKRETFIF